MATSPVGKKQTSIPPATIDKARKAIEGQVAKALEKAADALQKKTEGLPKRSAHEAVGAPIDSFGR